MPDFHTMEGPMTYPATESERDELRTEYLEAHTLAGVKAGLRAGRSLKCQQNSHDCANDGSTCICICHDRKE